MHPGQKEVQAVVQRLEKEKDLFNSQVLGFLAGTIFGLLLAGVLGVWKRHAINRHLSA